MRFVRVVASLLLGVGMFALAGPNVARAQTDPVYDRVMKERKMRVFALQGPLPQTFRDGDTFKGFDADMMNAIAKRLGVQIEMVWGTAAAMVPTMTSGRADISVAFYRTPEREKVVDFTDPYKWVTDHILVHLDDKSISTIDDLKTKKLAAVRGSAEEIAANKMKEAGYVKEVASYDLVDAAYRDLIVKRVDALIDYTITILWTQKVNPDLKGRLAFEVDPKYFGRAGRSPSQFPVPKGATKFRDEVNKIIKAMQDSGEVEKIFASYGITDKAVFTPPKE